MLATLTQEYLDGRLFLAECWMADFGMDVLEHKFGACVSCYRSHLLKNIHLNNLIESIRCYVVGDENECLTEAQVMSILERIDMITGSPSNYTQVSYDADSVPPEVAYMLKL